MLENMRGFFIFLVAIFILPGSAAAEISYSQAREMAASGMIEKAVFQNGNEVSIYLENGKKERVFYPENTDFVSFLDRQNVDVWVVPSEDITSSEPPGWVENVPLLPTLYGVWEKTFSTTTGILLAGVAGIIFVGVLLLISEIIQKRKRRKRREAAEEEVAETVATEPMATFRDVAGCGEVVEEVAECVEFLQDPTPFEKLGASMPSGIVLYGEPGTGKTLLARAVAGEAGVEFIHASGSSFVEKYVGVGAKNVRDLFERAREAEGGAVIFIDEVDALAGRRAPGDGSPASDEREATLNELLVQLDGFHPRERILVIAATNRLDRLDPAILRPGRFSRQIEVPLPSQQGRQEILELYAQDKKFDPDVSWREISEITASLSGADLADMLNEAAILAARKKQDRICKEDIEEAFIKNLAGPERKNFSLSAEERATVAYHEAGHALASEICPDHPSAEKVTIRPRNRGAGGLALYGQRDQALHYGDDIHQKLVVLLAGRAAEQIQFGRVSSGASSDLDQASSIARQAIEQLGFSAQGQSVHNRRIQLSDDAHHQIDTQVRESVERAYEDALRILQTHKQSLDNLAGLLLERETISRNEIADAVGSVQLSAEEGRSLLSHSFAPAGPSRKILPWIKRARKAFNKKSTK